MTYLSGYTGERILADSLLAAGCKPVLFNSITLIETACSFEIGVNRFIKALPAFLYQYGHLLKNQPLDLANIPDRQINYILNLFHWYKIPASIIIDWIFGCDCIFNYHGYILGFDSTTRKSAVLEKSLKAYQGKLKPLWQEIGLDYFAIAFVKSSSPPPREKIKPVLSQVIKGKCDLIEI
ncbi:MAG TPA: hypothetical protein V6D15_16060 [Oculatellaceae cyanobacterium]|jgi:hypothetical protein